RLQVKADRVLVYAQLAGDLGAGARPLGAVQHLEHFLASRSGGQVGISGRDLHPTWSPCGGTAATRGVSTPRWPILAAPPGEPSGSSRPGRVVTKKSSLSWR